MHALAPVLVSIVLLSFTGACARTVKPPPDDTWTAVQGSPFGKSDIHAIAYGGNRWIAAGEDGKIAYSNDGIIWTAVQGSPFGKSDIHAIAYGANRWIAAGEDGKIAYSNDGITWTAVQGSPFGKSDIHAVVCGGRFIAVGGRGMAASSDDGITWNTVIPKSPFRVLAGGVVHMPGGKAVSRFVIAGDGEIAYADDGITWLAAAHNIFGTYTYVADYAYTYKPFSTSPHLAIPVYSTAPYPVTALAYGAQPGGPERSAGGRFVAAGGGGKMAYSDDGAVWSLLVHTLGTTRMRAIAYGVGPAGRNTFVAAGDDAGMAYSSDGISWSAARNNAFGRSDIYALAFGGGRFIAAGEDGKMAWRAWP